MRRQNSTHSYDYFELNDLNLNIEAASENIFLGPQADILEQLDRFNRRWRAELRLTKKFYWAPKSYNMAKQKYVDEGLMFKMKPSGMHSIFDRIANYSWGANNYKKELLDIENKRLSLIRQGIVMTDNTEQINIVFDEILSKLSTWNESRNVSVLAAIPEYTDHYHKYMWVITVKLAESQLRLTNRDTHIANFPLEKVELLFEIPMFKHVNAYLVNNPGNFRDGYGNRNNSRIKTFGFYHGQFKNIKHPYISSYDIIKKPDYEAQPNMYLNDSMLGNVCFGDLQQDILKSIYQLKLEETLTMLNIWSNNYNIPHTGPLNNIRYVFSGKPGYLDDDALLITGRHEQCGNDMFMQNYSDDIMLNDYPDMINYCDESDCQLKTACLSYQRFNATLLTEYSRESYDRLIVLGLNNSQIRDYYPAIFTDDDSKIEQCMIAIEGIYKEYNEICKRLEDRHIANPESFSDVLFNTNSLKTIREISLTSDEELEKMYEEGRKDREDRILRDMLANGMSAIPIERNRASRTSMERAADAEENPNWRTDADDIQEYREILDDLNDNQTEEDIDEPFLNNT